MAELVFEIWCDDVAGERSVTQISENSDRVRLATMPNATLVYTFSAASDFDALQKTYDWHGWGTWRPAPNRAEQAFTDDQAAAQALFIAKWTSSQPT